MCFEGDRFMSFVRSFITALLVCLTTSLAYAQGVQTGTIRGIVHDQQGLAMPGVTVTAASPTLQGLRSVVTDSTGGFTLPNLPPGTYTVTYELAGFATTTQKSNVLLGLVVDQNVTMRTAGVAETVQVVAESPAPIATP